MNVYKVSYPSYRRKKVLVRPLRNFEEIGFMEQMQKLVHDMKEYDIDMWTAVFTEKEWNTVIAPLSLVCSHKRWISAEELEYMNPNSVIVQLLHKLEVSYTFSPHGDGAHLLEYNVSKPWERGVQVA